MVHILPQEFQAEDRNQEGQEIDPIPVSSEDSQVSMVQDESEVATPMETEDESKEVSINLSYPFEYPITSMTQHVKPLYIKAFFDGIQMNRVLMDNGAQRTCFQNPLWRNWEKETPD